MAGKQLGLQEAMESRGAGGTKCNRGQRSEQWRAPCRRPGGQSSGQGSWRRNREGGRFLRGYRPQAPACQSGGGHSQVPAGGGSWDPTPRHPFQAAGVWVSAGPSRKQVTASGCQCPSIPCCPSAACPGAQKGSDKAVMEQALGLSLAHSPLRTELQKARKPGFQLSLATDSQHPSSQLLTISVPQCSHLQNRKGGKRVPCHAKPCCGRLSFRLRCRHPLWML